MDYKGPYIGMEEYTMQKKTCCMTGNRDIPADKLDYVRQELEQEIKAALEDGYREFLTFFEEGAGCQWQSENVQ